MRRPWYSAEQYLRWLRGEPGDITARYNGLNLKSVSVQKVRDGRWVFTTTDPNEIKAVLPKLDQWDRDNLRALISPYLGQLDKLSYGLDEDISITWKKNQDSGRYLDTKRNERYDLHSSWTTLDDWEQILVEHPLYFWISYANTTEFR